jgi:hypothetical protein
VKPSDRKAAIQQYKSRAVRHGIVAVRCTATGDAWVGASTRPGIGHNALWFQLRLNASRNPKMQAAWNAHGDQSFVYEMVEEFDEKLSPYKIEVAVKERLPHWMERLNAAPLV